jgi:ElaB/YqjD/DUF883 family membrane-anchored ribosome-binding protein
MESTMNESMTRSRAMDKAETVKNDVKKRVKDGVETVEREASEIGDNVARGASDLADAVSSRLKTVGVDTQVMTDLAKDHASELQRMIGDELRARPMRALGIAAAIGVLVGLMTAR